MRLKLNGTVVSNGVANLYRKCGIPMELCCPNDVRQAIEQCPEDEELVLEINSGGGSVYAGFEMYNVIRSCGRKVKAEIQSIAGSAMSVVVCACHPVLISPVANFMIHRSACGPTYGNTEVHEQAAQMLHSIDESMLNAYEEKAAGKTSRTQFRHMIENETFMTPEKAVECGLADGLLESSAGGAQSVALNPMLATASIADEPFLTLTTMGNQFPDILDVMEEAQRAGLNIDCPESDSVQNKNQEEGETMEEQEIKTVEALEEAYPELTAKIREEAATAERNRIEAIEAVALPGYEEIVRDAKADQSKTAGSVAMAIIADQKQRGANYLHQAKAEAESSGANAVKGESKPESDDEEDPVAAAKEAVRLFQNLKGGGF